MKCSSRSRRLIPVTAVAACGLWTANAAAEEATDGTPPPTAAEPSALAAEAGVSLTNAYFFRGLLQEDEGAITQPWLQVDIQLAKLEAAEFSGFAGVWSSFHGSSDTAQSDDDLVEHWYESDFYAGLSCAVASFDLSLMHTYYTSPSDAFGTIAELSFCASYDDSTLWKDSFALNPSLSVAVEIDDEAGSEDSYLELGVEPAWDLDLGQLDLALSVPVAVGLGLDDYYVDASGDSDTFGYLSVGVGAAQVLPVSDRYGAWTLSGGVELLYLGDAAAEANDDDDIEVVASIGLSVAF